jgi:hypothetical protein
MMKGRCTRLAALVASVLVVTAGTAGATVARDATPTTFSKQAKALGITKAGSSYRFRKEQRSGDEGRLTVQLPTAWSDLADSQFTRPGIGTKYGVGVRATPDADKFHSSFDVPGVKLTLTTKMEDSPAEIVARNAVGGSCHPGSLRKFDDGIYEGMYQTFEGCGSKKAVAIVVAGVDFRGDVKLFAVGLALTKADLKAFDHILATAKLEKTSV